MSCVDKGLQHTLNASLCYVYSVWQLKTYKSVKTLVLFNISKAYIKFRVNKHMQHKLNTRLCYVNICWAIETLDAVSKASKLLF